jgi:hypothetical protein
VIIGSESLCCERSFFFANLFGVIRGQVNFYGLFGVERMQKVPSIAHQDMIGLIN